MFKSLNTFACEGVRANLFVQDRVMTSAQKIFAACILSLSLVLIGPVSAEEADEIVEDVLEDGVYIAKDREQIQQLDLIVEEVERIKSEDELNIVVAYPIDPEPDLTDFTENLQTESQAQVSLVIPKDGNPVAYIQPELAEADDEDSIIDNLECSLESIEELSDEVERLKTFSEQLRNGCPEEIEEAQEVQEFEGESISFVADEVGDDGVYIGKTSELDEEAIIEAVREVRTNSELRLIVVAPDNPQPTAAAFARRLHDKTLASVLLLREDGRAVSYVPEDKTLPRDSEVNAIARNQACATSAAWEQKDEVRAVKVFADRLSNGCPFEPPTFLLAVVGSLLFLVGILGVIVVKEREQKAERQIKNIPPPQINDKVELLDS